MGIPVLIMGKSGSGKSTSLRTFGENEILLINVSRKPLPFKNKFNAVMDTDDYNKIARAMKKLDCDTPAYKTVVIDDAGYLITNMFMKGHSAKGVGKAIFDFYNDIADRFWHMIDYIYTLPENIIVYIVMHEEYGDNGEYKPKTIGKILDEKVCLEGMFTIVLRCITQDGNHYFKTRTDGTDVSKSPPNMFEGELIENDLKAVDTAIRNYYELGGNTNE